MGRTASVEDGGFATFDVWMRTSTESKQGHSHAQELRRCQGGTLSWTVSSSAFAEQLEFVVGRGRKCCCRLVREVTWSPLV